MGVFALTLTLLVQPAIAGAWTTAIVGPGPRSVAVAPDGSIYTVNFGSADGSQGVSRITPTGVASAACATTGTRPHSLVVDQSGNAYATRYGSNGVVRIPHVAIVDPSVAPTCGTSDLAWSATGATPTEIAIDATGTIFTANGGGTVTRIVQSGSPIGSTGTPSGSLADGYRWSYTGQNPRGIIVDEAGIVFTASSDRHTVTKITPSGSPTGATGTPSGTAPEYQWGATGTLTSPWGVAIDSAGNVYTANTNTSTVSKINADGTSAGAPWPVTVGSSPYGIIIDSAGNLYTANFGSNTISRVSPAGDVTPVFASVGSGPFDLTIDGDGYLYTANQTGNSVTRVAGAAPAPPAVPAAPTAVAGAARATITAPATTTNAQFGTPTGFVMTTVEDPSRTCTVTLSSGTTCEITGLTPGTAYSFTAAAVRGAWTTDPSTASVAVTPFGVPGAPTNVVASAGDGQAVVTWDAPSSDGGSPITGYTVASTPDGRTCTWTSGPLTCTISGLANGTAYGFTVTAENVAGQGSPSSASAPVTPAAPPTPTPSPDPTPSPNPGPGPGPSPDPTPTVSVEILSERIRGSVGIVLRVRVDQPGMLRVVGTRARDTMRAGRQATIRACSGAGTATRAGEVVLTCRFTGSMRQRITERSVAVRLTVTLLPAGREPATTSARVRVARQTPDPAPVTG